MFTKKNIFKVILPVLCLFIIIIIISTLNMHSRSKSIDPLAQQTLESFLTNLKEGNIDKALTYIIDTRFKDTTELKKFYEVNLKNGKLIDYKIIKVSRTDSTHIEISTSTRMENAEETLSPFTLLKQDGTWKVYITYLGKNDSGGAYH